MVHAFSVARRLGSAALVLATAGCATLSDDGGFGPVAADVLQRTGVQARWSRTAADRESVKALVAQKLEHPLTPDDAVLIALINNAGLQASYADLGIAEAELVRAGRLPNPRFSFSRISNSQSVEIERKFVVDIIGILLMPITSKLEAGRFRATQTAVAGEALRVAAETRRSYFTAVAASESVRYYEQVQMAANASAELARRMAAAGNWSQLAQAREQVFYAEATAQLARARQTALAERERLARLLGLGSDSSAIKLPERLPNLPASPRAGANLKEQVLERRLDIRMARQGLEATGNALELTNATRFVGVFDLAYKNKSDTGVPRQNGYEVELEVPLFDWGETKVAKAEAIYLQAVARLAEATGNAQSEARTAWGGYQTAYELARHYREEVVPRRKKIAEETLLRYNGMLLSVFELLADAREQVMSVNAAIEATRDFWLADADLDAAIAGGTPIRDTAMVSRSTDTTSARAAH
ncbi:MAG: TolC family protein [Betaproteobacteria bacterium]